MKTRLNRIQMSRRLMLAVAGLIIVLAAGAVLLSGPLSPAASTVAVAPCITGSAGDCIRFPGVTGTTLNGDAETLPDAFAGDRNFVIVSFDEGQLQRAQTWLPPVQEIAAARPDFAYYSVPALPDMAPAMRTLISGGLVMMVGDPALRDVTVVLYLEDIDAFTSALDLPDRSDIAALLLNADGDVLWRTTGDYNPDAGDALRTAVDAAGGK